MKSKISSLLALSVVSALTLAGCAQPGSDTADPADPAAFFAGKTIEIILPFDADGGTDITARLIAPMLSKYIPGNPSFQVVNRPGGNSILGSNEWARDAEDGLSLLWSSNTTSLEAAFGNPAFEFDWSEDVLPLAAVPTGSIMFANSTTGIKAPQDLWEAEGLRYGGLSPDGGLMVQLLSYHILDFPLDEVFGYESQSATRIAFEQGELNFDGQSTAAYLSSTAEKEAAGEVVPLYTKGFMDDEGEIVRDPMFPDLMTTPELYEAHFGEWPSSDAYEAYKFLTALSSDLSKPVWVHSDAPQVAIDAYRKAFVDMAESDEFKELVDDELGYDLVVGARLDEAAKMVTDPPQETLDWLRDFALEEYGTDLNR